MCKGDEIWPHLCLDQHDFGRTYDAQGTPHHRPKVERTVHHFDPSRCVFTREGESGRGRYGQDAGQVGLSRAELGG